jgi:hypothetical protein
MAAQPVTPPRGSCQNCHRSLGFLFPVSGDLSPWPEVAVSLDIASGVATLICPTCKRAQRFRFGGIRSAPVEGRPVILESVQAVVC